MKEISLDTVGGRIRKVRQDADQTLQTFAAPLGITGNYVSLVELGKRNPSEELLRKISSTMGTSYDWLAYGDQPRPQESHPVDDTARVVADPAPLVNPQLYLSIALGMTPTITKEALAPMLAVPPQTIDDILAGEAVPYNQRWRTGYTNVAKNLDLPALRRDLRNLNTYLEWEEATIKNTAMLSALQEYAATKSGEQVEVSSINGQAPSAVPAHIPYTDIALTYHLICHNEAYTFTWQFLCPLEQEHPEDFSPEDVLEHAEALAEQRGCKVSIVLTSQAEYSLMSDHCNKLETDAGADDVRNGLSPLPQNSTKLPQNVSLIYFDQMTEKVEEWEFSEDDYSYDEL